MTLELKENDLEKMLKDAADTFEPPAGLKEQIQHTLLTEAAASTTVKGYLFLRLWKPAIAAAILLAALAGAGIFWFSGAKPVAAFADIVRNIVDTRTATFKTTISGEGVPTQEFAATYMDPGRMRMERKDSIVVTDLPKGRIVTLVPAQKMAIVIKAINMPKESGDLNLFEGIKQRLQMVQANKDANVTALEPKVVDGRRLVGYKVPSQEGGQEMIFTIWADAETALPVSIEFQQGKVNCAMTDVKFGVDVDESQFSLDIPKDYKVNVWEQDMSEPTEADLIEMLKTWTAGMDGMFPEKIDRNMVDIFVKHRGDALKAGGKEPNMDDINALQKLIAKITRGGMFYAGLPKSGNKHYAGKGVKLNTPDTPILWYLPQGAKVYRVIYADLTVKDLPADQLPAKKTQTPTSTVTENP